jgi:hypothetical protein
MALRSSPILLDSRNFCATYVLTRFLNLSGAVEGGRDGGATGATGGVGVAFRSNGLRNSPAMRNRKSDC